MSMTQVSRNTTTNVVEMIGSSLGERTGCVVEDVDAATYALVLHALEQPHGGVLLSQDHKVVNALPVPEPTQAEQDRIATRAAALATMKDKSKSPTARLDALIVALGL